MATQDQIEEARSRLTAPGFSYERKCGVCGTVVEAAGYDGDEVDIARAIDRDGVFRFACPECLLTSRGRCFHVIAISFMSLPVAIVKSVVAEINSFLDRFGEDGRKAFAALGDDIGAYGDDIMETIVDGQRIAIPNGMAHAMRHLLVTLGNGGRVARLRWMRNAPGDALFICLPFGESGENHVPLCGVGTAKEHP